MKLTAQRDITIRDIEPGEAFVNDEGRWTVDEVRHSLAGVTLFCLADGSTSNRRKPFEFKNLDEKVTVEAGPQDRSELLALLEKLITVPEHMERQRWPYDADAGVLTLTLGTRVVGKAATRIWRLDLEA